MPEAAPTPNTQYLHGANDREVMRCDGNSMGESRIARTVAVGLMWYPVRLRWMGG